ncbi:TonB family protein [Denitrovibrio acetiphilus DSM 12809]|uniref:TonB family protein n=1 Tax=Denitrovibrio acetiphilus (strain DSM 12809 / NBRC 114555 / N2460) TaxID=522772 RepID=D4H8M5_DENA2|nr:energy transducer TonB [Denitrovibrio acetiphilus]ADD68374.1 TonB family protein [Denitrovibrio acetiphilus DSM 12809]
MKKHLNGSITLFSAVVLAVLINLLIFIGIPFLSAATAGKPGDIIDSFVSFSMEKPMKRQDEEIEKKREEEKKPEKLPEMNLKHTAHKLTRPKLDVSLPDLSFDINASLSDGVAVSVPAGGGSFAGGVKLNFDIGEVDTPPSIVYKTDPVYPFTAKRRQVTGKVILKFLVKSSGEVSDMQIVSSEPEGVFDEAVRNAIARWRFKPGIYDGKPVNTWVVAPFEFRM